MLGNASVFGFRPRPSLDLDHLHRCGDLCIVLNGIFDQVRPLIHSGITTAELDRGATSLIDAVGCESLYRNLPLDYPAAITASVNDQVVNTPPSSRPLQSGDLLKLQIGIMKHGAYASQAWTFFVDMLNEPDAPLYQAGVDALHRAINTVRVGSRVRHVSTAIQSTLESLGFSPGRDFQGHGIGHNYHVEPGIPCFVDRLRAKDLNHVFVEHQLLAIHTFAHAGSTRTTTKRNYSVVAVDGSRSVNFSHTVVVEREGCRVLSSAYS